VDIFVCPHICEISVTHVISKLENCDEINILILSRIKGIVLSDNKTRTFTYTSPLSGRTLANA
jgi:hypothetical protein